MGAIYITGYIINDFLLYNFTHNQMATLISLFPPCDLVFTVAQEEIIKGLVYVFNKTKGSSTWLRAEYRGGYQFYPSWKVINQHPVLSQIDGSYDGRYKIKVCFNEELTYEVTEKGQAVEHPESILIAWLRAISKEKPWMLSSVELSWELEVPSSHLDWMSSTVDKLWHLVWDKYGGTLPSESGFSCRWFIGTTFQLAEIKGPYYVIDFIGIANASMYVNLKDGSQYLFTGSSQYGTFRGNSDKYLTRASSAYKPNERDYGYCMNRQYYNDCLQLLTPLLNL